MKMILWTLVGIVVAFVGFFAFASYPWSIQETSSTPGTITVNPGYMPETSEGQQRQGYHVAYRVAQKA